MYCSNEDDCTGGFWRIETGDCRLFPSSSPCNQDTTCGWCNGYLFVECEPSTGVEPCNSCTTGKYKSTVGADECSSCAYGLTSFSPFVTCEGCSVGTYYNVQKDFTSIATPYTAHPQIFTTSNNGDVAVSPDCNYAIMTRYSGNYAVIVDLSNNAIIKQFSNSETYAAQWITNDRVVFMTRQIGRFVIADKIDGVWTEIDPYGGTYNSIISGNSYGMDELMLWAPPDGSYFLFATADSGRDTSCIKKYTFSTDSWTAMVGQCTSQGDSDHTNGLLAKFKNPSDIAVNADQTQAYIADMNNHRLKLWDMVTNEVTGQSSSTWCQICTKSLFGYYPATVQYTPDYKHLIVGQARNAADAKLYSVDMTTYVVTELDDEWHYVKSLSFCRQLTDPFMLVNRNEQIRKVEFVEGEAACESCPAEAPLSVAGSNSADGQCTAKF